MQLLGFAMPKANYLKKVGSIMKWLRTVVARRKLYVSFLIP